MATQPVPSVSRGDVERIVRRDFPADRQAEALSLLDGYGPEIWHHAPDRVHLPALKLAAGRIEALRSQIEDAKHDYRDVIGIVDADWQQYQEWLARDAA